MADKQKYFIEGMDCADCALTIERGVQKLDGVQFAQVNFSTAQLLVEGRVKPEALKQRVENLGYRLTEYETLSKAGSKPALFLDSFDIYSAHWKQNWPS